MYTYVGIVEVPPMLPEWCSLGLHVRWCEVVAARPALPEESPASFGGPLVLGRPCTTAAAATRASNEDFTITKLGKLGHQCKDHKGWAVWLA